MLTPPTTIIRRKKSLPFIMQPHSHGNHDFPICINHYVRGLAELHQLQHPPYNQQPQYQPLQHQQQYQGHAIPIYGPHINASSTLSYP